MKLNIITWLSLFPTPVQQRFNNIVKFFKWFWLNRIFLLTSADDDSETNSQLQVLKGPCRPRFVSSDKVIIKSVYLSIVWTSLPVRRTQINQKLHSATQQMWVFDVTLLHVQIVNFFSSYWRLCQTNCHTLQ